MSGWLSNAWGSVTSNLQNAGQNLASNLTGASISQGASNAGSVLSNLLGAAGSAIASGSSTRQALIGSAVSQAGRIAQGAGRVLGSFIQGGVGALRSGDPNAVQAAADAKAKQDSKSETWPWYRFTTAEGDISIFGWSLIVVFTIGLGVVIKMIFKRRR